MSDSDMPYARGRGKRMRLAIPDQPSADPSLSKIRGLSHKRRGVGIGNKGRRGSLNLSGCRTPGYYAVEDIKSNPLMCGKRKGKAPADLDLSLVSEDIRNGNGKRIRAKSRSAPSTPQGKSTLCSWSSLRVANANRLSASELQQEVQTYQRAPLPPVTRSPEQWQKARVWGGERGQTFRFWWSTQLGTFWFFWEHHL